MVARLAPFDVERLERLVAGRGAVGLRVHSKLLFHRAGKYCAPAMRGRAEGP
jgi:hypothetical protein